MNVQAPPMMPPRTRVAWLPGRVSPSPGAALILWLIGCATTYQCLQEWSPVDSITIAGRTFGLWPSAFVTQAVLTILEIPYWRGNRGLRLARGAVFVDTAINAGGLWSAAQSIDNTRAWDVLSAIVLTPANAVLAYANTSWSSEVGPFFGAILAMIFGYYLAAAPEEAIRGSGGAGTK